MKKFLRQKFRADFCPGSRNSRLRDVINKNVTEEDLLRRRWLSEWQDGVKLFHGRSSDRDIWDLDGITDLANKVDGISKLWQNEGQAVGYGFRRLFVPKPLRRFSGRLRIPVKRLSKSSNIFRRSLKTVILNIIGTTRRQALSKRRLPAATAG